MSVRLGTNYFSTCAVGLPHCRLHSGQPCDRGAAANNGSPAKIRSRKLFIATPESPTYGDSSRGPLGFVQILAREPNDLLAVFDDGRVAEAPRPRNLAQTEFFQQQGKRALFSGRKLRLNEADQVDDEQHAAQIELVRLIVGLGR